MEKTQHIVILAAGDFPTHREAIALLVNADCVVCCDSAYEGYLRSGNDKGNCLVVGDGDSLPAETKRSLGDRWIHVAEQDYNDLHKAMSFAVSKFEIKNTKYTILGATGRREDHTLGNISYLATFAEEYPGIEIEMLTDYGRFTVFRGSRIYDSFPGQQVSIFSMDSDKPLYSEGLKWPLDGLVPRRWWQATLNESLAQEFTLGSAGWTVVFQNYLS